MVTEVKERSSFSLTNGRSTTPGSSISNPWSKQLKVRHQRTRSEDHPLFHFVQREKRLHRMPDYWMDFMSRQDLGGAFMTEEGWFSSSHSNMKRNGLYFNMPWEWAIEDGPLTLAGFEHPLDLATSTEITNLEQTLFALGGAAISRTRPGKPGVDLAVTLGELRKDGIPNLVGSLYASSKSFRDIFRNSGNEYLNVQFGWAPLLRDVQALCHVVLDTRKVLESHEKQLNKLLRRTYRFDTHREVISGVSKTMSSYEMHPSQQGTVFSYCRFDTQLGGQVPQEDKVIETKSHFSAGYRFYYPEIDTALDKLTEFEHNANLLLGTRIDPETLWNLAPWTWLVDWFINFGDVMGNISAIIADGLVMQYAYIMQETSIRQEITLPRGLKTRQTSGMIFDNTPYTMMRHYTRKTRVKASPFGFGLTPEMFSSQQWAILAALGISRGLK